jgi:hypothetical protein
LLKQQVIVKWPFKLFVTENGDLELYNLSDDPGEAINLSRRFPEIVRKLSDELSDWKRNTPETKSDDDEAYTPEEIESLRALGYVQ